jgi:hypothetical protein
MFSVTGDPREHAAANIRYVAARHDDNGSYYNERDPQPPHPQASDPATQNHLQDVTSQALRDYL